MFVEVNSITFYLSWLEIFLCGWGMLSGCSQCVESFWEETIFKSIANCEQLVRFGHLYLHELEPFLSFKSCRQTLNFSYFQGNFDPCLTSTQVIAFMQLELTYRSLDDSLPLSINVQVQYVYQLLQLLLCLHSRDLISRKANRECYHFGLITSSSIRLLLTFILCAL